MPMAPEYNHKWKEIATPGGRIIPVLSVSQTKAAALKARLDVEAEMNPAGWTTPRCQDVRGENLETFQKRKSENRIKGGGASLAIDAQLVGWWDEVHLVGWATPRSTDGEKNSRTLEGAMREAARKGANNDLGTTAAISSAPMGKRGVLNQELPRWLMGYHAVWEDSAPGREDWLKWQDFLMGTSSGPKRTASPASKATEIRSTRSSRPSSSEHT